MKWKHVENPKQSFLPGLDVPSGTSPNPTEIRYSDAEYLGLCESLYDRAKTRRQAQEFIVEVVFEELLSAAAAAPVLTAFLPRDQSIGERRRAGSELGLFVKRYRNRIVRLRNGLQMRMSCVSQTRARRYRIVVGKALDLRSGSDRAQMHALVEALACSASTRTATAVTRVGGAPRRYEATKAEIRRIARAAGLFPWMALDTWSDYSKFGRMLARFTNEIFQLTGGRFCLFGCNGLDGRSRRYRIEFVKVASGQ